MLVKSFYRENAGALLFFSTMLFFVVGDFHGAGIVEYHYSLISGLLQGNNFLLLVFFAWFIYARKCVAFVSGVLYNPAYAFLHIFNYLSKAKRFALFLFVAICLLLPMLLYAILIIAVGWHLHLYFTTMLVAGYIVLLCVASAGRHVYLLHNIERKTPLPLKKAKWVSRLTAVYPAILIRFVTDKQKIIWLGIKVFTCGVLYGAARNNTLTQYEFGPVFLLANFGIIANSVLVYRTRAFETTYLAFYRGAAISLPKRLLEYALVWFILLLPEFITIGMLTPAHLHPGDAIRFALSSYSLVLLMYSITFIRRFSMRSYLKIILLLACIQFAFLITAALTTLCLLFFILAAICFVTGYYRFE